MSPRRVLITGGAGFIGAHLVRALAQDRSCDVMLVDNLSRGERDDDLAALTALPNVHLMEGDVTDARTFRQIGDGFDEVYHLAGVVGVRNVQERPQEALRVNVVGTITLLDWVAKGSDTRVLFASTSEVYAWTQQVTAVPIPTPEAIPLVLTDLTTPRVAYAASKMLGEVAVRQYCRTSGQPFVILRYHNIYGPRMGYVHVIPELLARVARGDRPLTVHAAGHRRAFCYVADAVDATIRAMRAPQAVGHTLNIGNDREEVTIDDLARRLVRLMNADIEIVPVEKADDPVRRRCPDLSLARALLGYDPKVGLDEGLQRTIDWYLRRIPAAIDQPGGRR